MEEGGETSLPLARAIDEERQKLPNPSECAAKLGIAVPPRRGDALMFFDLDPMGRQGQRAALHASCPTLKVRGWWGQPERRGLVRGLRCGRGCARSVWPAGWARAQAAVPDVRQARCIRAELAFAQLLGVSKQTCQAC